MNAIATTTETRNQTAASSTTTAAAISPAASPPAADPNRLAAILAEAPPTAGTLDALSFDRLSTAGRIDAIVAWEKLLRHAHAGLIRGLGTLARGESADTRWLAESEVCAALAWSSATAQARMSDAAALTRLFPETMQLLSQGQVSFEQARCLAQLTAGLEDDAAQAVETRILPRMAGQSASVTRQAIRRAVLRADPDAAAHRHRYERARRRVELRPEDDGMATLSFYLPADIAQMAMRTLTELAQRTKRKNGSDERTLDQLRADMLPALLLGSIGVASAAVSNSAASASGSRSGLGSGFVSRSASGSGSVSSSAATSGSGSGSDSRSRSGLGSGSASSCAAADASGSRSGSGLGSGPDAADASGSRSGSGLGSGPDAASAAGSRSGPGAGSASDPDSAAASRAADSAPDFGSIPAAPALISVVVNIETLLGLSHEPGHIDGYGPICPEQTRNIAHGHAARWRFLLTSSDGTLVDASERTYTPRAAIKRVAQLKYPTCTFPHCRMPAERCDCEDGCGGARRGLTRAATDALAVFSRNRRPRRAPPCPTRPAGRL